MRPLRILTGSLAIANAYQLLLLAAAALPSRPRPSDGGAIRFAVLIPAHDEERTLARALAALAEQTYPAELIDTVVVADNCSDGTAAVARDAGARVLERTDRTRRGKGWALAWAVPQLGAEYDALAVVDADCTTSPNFLAAAAARLASDASAVQSDDVITNADASPTAGLRAASFALLARVRARGKDRLGLSCGLFGTGMAFRREVVDAHAWHGDALDDGLDYHLQLVAAGVRVQFMPEAYVASEMPVFAAASESQQRRWEAGRLQALRRWGPRLARTGDAAAVHAVLDAAVPPQALLAAINVLLLLSRRERSLALANAVAQAAFVLVGLRLARAPKGAYTGLLVSPALVGQKVLVIARLARGRRGSWRPDHRS
jgi:cellulose synthase/poly-beta-1,6-N-acetylglucosamine synthase-like glycosyltransferase